MTTFNALIANYHSLRQQRSEQIETALQALQSQIAEQLAQLQATEQPLLEAQSQLLSQLRPQVEADARSLLSLAEFQQCLPSLNGTQLYCWQSIDRLEVAKDPTGWLLTSLPLPVQIRDYQIVRDNQAYNDEQHFTEYRYSFTAQLGSWQKELSAATVCLYPGDPMQLRPVSLRTQLADLTYRIFTKDRRRSDSEAEPEFAELQLDEAQKLQLKQELSCLLVFVGRLFYVSSQTEMFRYPLERWADD